MGKNPFVDKPPRTFHGYSRRCYYDEAIYRLQVATSAEKIHSFNVDESVRPWNVPVGGL